MPRPAGLNKTGGRKKGTPNKRSGELETLFEKAGVNIPEKIIALLPELEIEKQVDVLLNLMGYLFPKKKSVEQTIEVEAIVEERIEELSTKDIVIKIAAAQASIMDSFGRDYPFADDELKQCAKKVTDYFKTRADGNLDEEGQLTPYGLKTDKEPRRYYR